MQSDLEGFEKDNAQLSQEVIDLAEAQILEKQKISDYDIREYPIDVLVAKFTDNLEDDDADIFIPDYQREMIWTMDQKSRFIESILINLPIPYLFLADSDGRSEVVDGSQRIRTIVEFVQDQFRLKKLELLPLLENFQFSDLPKSRQRRFNKKTIRLIEMTQNMDEEARRQMFDRLNSGGTKLKPMEQRRGSRDGAFLVFLKKLASKDLFNELCPISENKLKRRENEEFVLRFFAYLDNYKSFDHRVDEFLNEYLSEMNEERAFNEVEYEKIFDQMLVFVKSNFSYGFKKTKNNNSVPRIRFEAISVGCALAIKENSQLSVSNVDWVFSKEFGHLTRSDASNSRTKVANRIHFVRDNLLEREIEYEGNIESIFNDPRKIDKQPELFD